MESIPPGLREHLGGTKSGPLVTTPRKPDAGAAIGDLTLANEGPIDEVARRVLDWLEWR